MADSDQQDRTQEPTGKRLADARREGRVPRSRDLSHLLVLGTAVLALTTVGGRVAQACRDVLTSGLRFDHATVSDPTRMGARLSDLSFGALWATLPLLAALMVGAVAGPLLIGGWNFSAKAVAPNFERLDPIGGMQRFFSLTPLVDLGKVMLIALMLSFVGGYFVVQHMEDFASLAMQSLTGATSHLSSILLGAFMLLTGTLAATAAIDVPYQITRYRNQLRMTVEEVRDEMRQSEGDPNIKRRVRRAQRDMARKRMMAAVPKADVIVTNPTHFAVALKYLQGRHRAPLVVAKGMGAVAGRIREIAAENSVPQLEAPPLARALYRHVEIGEEIPAALYTAVAQVLAYVYQLQRYRKGEGERPEEPRDIEIPAGLDPFEPRAVA